MHLNKNEPKFDFGNHENPIFDFDFKIEIDRF